MLQGYRDTGVQGSPLELFSSMVPGASNGAGFPWRWASPWPGFSLVPGLRMVPDLVPGCPRAGFPPPAGAGFLAVCRVPP